MAVTIDGTTGVSLVQDGVVATADLADGAVTAAKIGSLPAGSVLQVVQSAMTDGVGFTLNNTFSTVTALNTAITPSSTNSKILVRVFLYVCADGGTSPYPAFRFIKGGSPISGATGSTTSSRRQVTGSVDPGVSSNIAIQPLYGEFLDSPNTTSETTYGIQVIGYDNRTFNVGATGGSDGSSGSVTLQAMTLMEIAG